MPTTATAMPPNRDRSAARRPRLALVATLAVQACATLALTAASVMAPVVAPTLGVAPQRVGLFVGLAYLAAMFSGLAGGARVARMGAITMSRAAMLACAIGLAIAALGAATPYPLAMLVPAAIAIGVGYGLPNPAASIVLAVHAPPARRGLFFSIKQSGVPLGVAAAGLLVPALLALTSWPWAIAALATGCAALAAALRFANVLESRDVRERPTTSPVGTGRPACGGSMRASGASLRAFVAPLARVWREPALRRLGVASLVFSMMQLCFVTFLVSHLTIELGMPFASAAALLAGSQVASVGCRVMWGAVADRWVRPQRLLAALGASMAIAIAAIGLLPAGSPGPLVGIAVVACAATSMAWNGVFFAELARRVDATDLAPITGGTQFLTFAGAMTGPVAFASLVGPIGGHGATYSAFALAPAAVGLWLWRVKD